MKSTTIFFLLTVLYLLPFSATSCTIHGILVIDTLDQDIKLGCQKDKNNMIRYVNRMSRAYSTKQPKIKVFEGKTFKKNKILEHIKSLNVKSEDIIVFYFTGHGGWMKNKGFSLKIQDSIYLNFNNVNNLLDEKTARLKLIITDACKTKIPSRRGDIPKLSIPIENEKINNNFNELLSYSGTIIASSCKKNEESYTSNEGSYFTISFLQAISFYAESQNPSWFGISQKATKFTKTLAKKKLKLQTPKFILKLRTP